MADHFTKTETVYIQPFTPAERAVLDKPPQAPADMAPEPAAAEIPTGILNTQPTFIAGLVVGLPTVVYNLADAFGWFTFTGVQKSAVLGAYTFITAGVFGWLYSRVSSPATAARLKAEQP